MNKCKECGKLTSNLQFCSAKCRGVSKSKEYRGHPTLVDLTLKTIAKLNGGYLPHGTLTDVANEVGLSRERVRQRQVYLGLPSIRKSYDIVHTRKCDFCGNDFVQKGTKVFCSDKCASDFHFYRYRDIKICKNCGLGFFVMKGRSNGYASEENGEFLGGSNRQFCSKTCFGKHQGRTLGWGKQGSIKPLFATSRAGLIRDLGTLFKATDLTRVYGYSSNSLPSVIEKMKERRLIEEMPNGYYLVPLRIKTK